MLTIPVWNPHTGDAAATIAKKLRLLSIAPFGVTGGARRVELQGSVVPRGWNAGIVGRLFADPRFVRLPALVAVECDDAGARQQRLDLLDAVSEIGADEKDRRTGIGHHVCDLHGAESRQFTQTQTAFSLAAPKSSSKYSGRFLSRNATRPRAFTPAARIAWAT